MAPEALEAEVAITWPSTVGMTRTTPGNPRMDWANGSNCAKAGPVP